jgi:hypothetical protein
MNIRFAVLCVVAGLATSAHAQERVYGPPICVRFDSAYFILSVYHSGAGTTHRPTALVQLDTAPATTRPTRDYRLVPLAVDTTGFPPPTWTKPPYWRRMGNSIYVSWHTGLWGPVFQLTQRGDTLTGTVTHMTDAIGHTSSGVPIPFPSHPVKAVVVGCS